MLAYLGWINKRVLGYLKMGETDELERWLRYT
jgi:hypothetical protein